MSIPTLAPSYRLLLLVSVLSTVACDRFRNNAPPDNSPARQVERSARSVRDHAEDLGQNIEDAVDPPSPAERARDTAHEVRDDVRDEIHNRTNH